MIMKAPKIVLELKFPVGMLGIVLHLNRKPFAHSFLPVWLTNMPYHNRKPFAHSFLSVWYTKVFHHNRKPIANSFLPVW